MSPIKVAIADDHPLIAEGISNMLRYQEDIELIATYPDGDALMKGLTAIQPDILLLDIQMPGLQGDDIAKIIKANYPDIGIIVLTSFDNIFYIRNMLQHKVGGYLLKNTRKDELITAINMVYQGATYIDKAVAKILQEDEQIIKRQKALGSLLTKRESEILQLIAQNYTSVEIAEQLFISKRTVEHHRESIFNKMDVKKVSTLIKKAMELNLIPPEQL